MSPPSPPTGSTIIRRYSADRPEKLELGTPLAAAEMADVPLLASLSKGLLEKMEGSVVRREFEKGEVICRQGDYGSTAFYIVQGACDVFITTAMSHVENEPRRGLFGIVKKMGSLLKPRGTERRTRPLPSHIRIDAPVDLPSSELCATIGAGSLFGEMTCLNFYPRSATVIARERVVCIELLRNVLDALYRAEPQAVWRKQRAAARAAGKPFETPRPEDGPIGKVYRERSLKNHLRSCELFRNVSDEFLERLRVNAEIVMYEPGEAICRQGERADEFYIVRIGFVRVTQNMPGGEMVLEYLSRGQYFGEIGLLARAEGKEAQRTATCTAIDHVEVVTIGGRDFEELITQHPEVRRSLAAEAQKRLKANADQLAVTRTVELGEFLDQGLIQAQSLLVLDLERCTRCDECVRACADSHDGVTRLIRDGLRFDKYLVATSCRSCLDPVCMIGCPVGSIRRNATREIVIEDWCIGCDLCAKNCPYGNINMHPFEVAFDSQLFAKQQPMRQVRAKLSPLPSAIDVTAMPEGLSYDERAGYLVYTNVPDDKRTKELRGFNDDPAYQQAVDRLLREMETRVPLPLFPSDFKPAKSAAAFVRYDEKERSLVFLGVIGPEEKDDYKAFSADEDYKRAVDAAARKSYAKKAYVTKATTCDLCESLKQEPNCVYACPHDAAKRVEPKKFFRPLLRGQGELGGEA